MNILAPYRKPVGYCALLLCASVLAGCPKKATPFRNDRGGYTLISDADSVEKAMIRFQRTADDLYPGQFHQFSDPHLISQSTHVNVFGGGGTFEGWQVDLTCSGEPRDPR